MHYSLSFTLSGLGSLSLNELFRYSQSSLVMADRDVSESQFDERLVSFVDYDLIDKRLRSEVIPQILKNEK
ncbi:hypothetical protein CFAM422_011133 [Trichoderma lentiforme]|uniref:Uncharacterized protein n=1 Tax=Trichoderma lentiforme TaxID=1567552 RepID=A0A9P4X6A8_9HYPO|nr:hypothetical protein CFAM422_011133 [Trichoderma lentiforme]